MSTVEFKPCPFCGSINIHVMKMGYPHWVYCENCGAKIHGRVLGEEEGEKASVEAWNRRSVEDEMTLLEAIKCLKHIATLTGRNQMITVRPEGVLTDDAVANFVNWLTIGYQEYVLDDNGHVFDYRNAASAITWHDAATIFPPNDEKVLCLTRTKAGRWNHVLGYYAADLGRWVCGNNTNVLYWTELPAPPEMEGEE